MPVSAVVCVSACCQLQTFRGTESVCDSSRPHHLLHASRILRRLLLHLHRTLPRLPARRVSNRPPSSYFVAVISCIWAFSASDTVGWTWWRASGLIKKIEWWVVDVVICLGWGADCLHMVQLMPVHPKTPSSLASFKSRLVLPFWLSWEIGR